MQLLDGERLWVAALMAVVVVLLVVPLFLLVEWLYAAGRDLWDRYRDAGRSDGEAAR